MLKATLVVPVKIIFYCLSECVACCRHVNSTLMPLPLVLAAGETWKEILYRGVTVILGGLVSSTVLKFFVHPALFWCFGMQDSQKVRKALRSMS